ncbi:MAG: archease [Bradymonadales bacterium]|nr:archease [Bradymonadales bacterium]
MRRIPQYEWLEHTADIKIRLHGARETDLYESAALAMTEIIAEGLDGEEIDRSFTICRPTPEERLVELLRELLFCFDVHRLLPVAVKAHLHGDQLQVATRCLTFDPNHHVGLREIKAITYHELKVEREKAAPKTNARRDQDYIETPIWFADLVFDV